MSKDATRVPPMEGTAGSHNPLFWVNNQCTIQKSSEEPFARKSVNQTEQHEIDEEIRDDFKAPE